MTRVIVLGALVLAIVVGTIIGCGPRAEVAANKMLDQIDKVLGELDVKRTAIEQKRRALVKDMLVLRDKRIGTEVRLEQLQKKKEASESKLKESRGQLQKLKQIVSEASESGTVERNGITFTAEEIGRSATKLGNQFKLAETNVKSLQTSIDALTRSVNFLKSQEKTTGDLMMNLDSKISEIDNKKIAIDAVRHASSVTGGDASINDKINELNKEIDDMFVNIETKMRVEEAKLNQLQSDTISADEILAEPTDLGGVMADIDALLGETNDDNQ